MSVLAWTLVSALLQLCTEDDLRGMRVKLFETALDNGSAHPKDILVKRLKRAVGPTLATKYPADIADLCYAIRNEQLVPRTLLKNGKRSAAAFLASRSRNSPNCQSLSPPQPIDGDKPSDSHSSESLCCPENNRAIASLTRELDSLRHDVTQLKSDIVSLKSTSNNESCLIYVRLKNLETDHVHESLLNAILHCRYSIICNLSLRVRIQKYHLHSALSSTDTRLDIVRLWRPNNATTAPSSSSSNQIENGAPCHPASAVNPSPTTLNLTTWNCRGLGSGEPYIHQLRV